MIVLQARGCRLEPRTQGERCKCRHNLAKRTNPLPFSQQEPENQKSHGKSQRPLVAFQRLPRGKEPCFRKIHGLDSLLENIPRRIRANRDEEPAGGFRDFREPVLVEARLNGFAGDIAHEVLPPVIGTERDQRAFGGADTYGEDPDSVLRRLFRGCDSIGIKFLTVGENDQRAGLALRLPECLFRSSDSRGDIGSAFRNDIRVQLVERVDHGGVVEGERGLEK